MGESPTRVRDRVYKELRKDILLGRFRPGTWLREVDLAARLNVSRTPIREAVRRLEQEGLLVASFGRGISVRQVTFAEALDAYELRALLEGIAARQAATRLTSEGRERLRRALERCKLPETAEQDALLEADLEFHFAISEAAENPPLASALRALLSYFIPFHVATRIPSDRLALHPRHEELVIAIESRNPDTAEDVMRKHVDASPDAVARRISQWQGS